MEKPEKVEYPDKTAKFRYYGHIIRKMVKYAMQLEEGELKEGLKISIANQMKKSYIMWNKDTVEDRVIFHELKELSDGQLVLEGVELSQHQQYKTQTQHNNNRGRNKRKSNKRKYKK